MVKIIKHELKLDLCISEYAGHATDIVSTLTLSEWYGIIIVSGDGLIFEVRLLMRLITLARYA